MERKDEDLIKTLLDRDPHGLIARIELPLGQQVLKAGLSPMRPRTAAAE